MKKTWIINIGMGFLIFCVGTTTAFSQQKTNADQHQSIWSQDIDGLAVSVEKAWLYKQSSSNSRPILVVNLAITNKNENRKFDLSNGLRVRLTDEFGNVYQPQSAPPDFSESIEIKNPSHPSLYPSETYRRFFFFEPPLHTARLLTLDVSLDFIQEKTQQVHLMIPTHKIAQQDKTVFRIPTDEDLAIRTPRDGVVVSPGKRVLVTIEVSQDVPEPSKIYVLAPPHTLVDDQNKRRYIVLIPNDVASDSYEIAVMALWDRDGEPITITKAVTLTIKNNP